MPIVNIHHAKTHLSQLVNAVAAGEEVVIARAGRPVARLVPFEPAAPAMRQLGLLDGTFSMPEDFDAPLRDEVLAAFEGR